MKTSLRLDVKALEPFVELSAVLGVTLEAYLENMLTRWIAPTELFLIYEEELREARYDTREEAQKVAERFEIHAVSLILDGRDFPTAVGDVMLADDGLWKIEPDYLGANGWMSAREEGSI
jgi:hypothetical protein